MMPPHGLDSRSLARIAAVLGALLVLGGAASDFHHHGDAAPHRECGVCVAGHALAVTTASLEAPRPAPLAAQHVAAPAERAHARLFPTSTPSRAPPLA